VRVVEIDSDGELWREFVESIRDLGRARLIGGGSCRPEVSGIPK